MNPNTTCDTCSDSQCSARTKHANESEDDFIVRQELLARMCRIKHKIMVFSGKGGVGKSTVAVNLATALAMSGKQVGLLDIDIHGPSIPKLLNIEDAQISGNDGIMHPVQVKFDTGSISVMSIGFLLRSKDDAIVWRGPRKFGVIKQLLKDVEWGELDYLVVDSPPGTGDEPLAIAELIEKPNGAIIVTTPQQLAVQDVRRCVVFCRQLNLPIIGVVENMSGFTCPKCGEHFNIFSGGGGFAMAQDMGVPYLGSLPIDPEIVVSGDDGTPIVKSKPDSATAKTFNHIVQLLFESNH